MSLNSIGQIFPFEQTIGSSNGNLTLSLGDSIYVGYVLGVDGDQGYTGDQGVTGAQGEQGAHGEQGAQGENGASGDSGTQGASGTQGESGTAGDVGITGDLGAQGAIGFKGNDTGIKPRNSVYIYINPSSPPPDPIISLQDYPQPTDFLIVSVPVVGVPDCFITVNPWILYAGNEYRFYNMNGAGNNNMTFYFYGIVSPYGGNVQASPNQCAIFMQMATPPFGAYPFVTKSRFP
jgi:hypothetical protein